MLEFRPYGLFYDALSGEFAPPSDPLNRRHTLARLAVATVEKGYGPKYLRHYIPSWAKDTEAYVGDGQDALVHNSIAFSSITILGKDRSRQFRFADQQARFTEASRNRHELVISDQKNLELILPLALGPELNNIRSQVTELAQEFYNHYPQKSA